MQPLHWALVVTGTSVGLFGLATAGGLPPWAAGSGGFLVLLGEAKFIDVWRRRSSQGT